MDPRNRPKITLNKLGLERLHTEGGSTTADHPVRPEVRETINRILLSELRRAKRT
jgi:hypothetical protein